MAAPHTSSQLLFILQRANALSKRAKPQILLGVERCHEVEAEHKLTSPLENRLPDPPLPARGVPTLIGGYGIFLCFFCARAKAADAGKCRSDLNLQSRQKKEKKDTKGGMARRPRAAACACNPRGPSSEKFVSVATAIWRKWRTSRTWTMVRIVW